MSVHAGVALAGKNSQNAVVALAGKNSQNAVVIVKFFFYHY